MKVMNDNLALGLKKKNLNNWEQVDLSGKQTKLHMLVVQVRFSHT